MGSCLYYTAIQGLSSAIIIVSESSIINLKIVDLESLFSTDWLKKSAEDQAQWCVIEEAVLEFRKRRKQAEDADTNSRQLPV